jgi:nitrite reductase/ring-hydroxylating ferredoxin subunit
LYRRELERFSYRSHRCCVGLEAEAPNPGDFKRAVVGECSVILVRDAAGGLNVVENVCAHRGMRFCRARHGQRKEFVCPYHQWSYTHQGDLCSARAGAGWAAQGASCAGRRRHRQALGQAHADLCGLQHLEHLPLGAVVGAGGVAGGGADAAVFLGDQALVGQRLVGGAAPELGAHALVQPLGSNLCDAAPVTDLANIFVMRLTPHEREVILRLGLRHFGRLPRLFGSRLNEDRRGGDIDLLIATDLPPGQAARRRIDLLADLWLELGERKIDIVLDDGSAPAPIVERARREGVEL